MGYTLDIEGVSVLWKEYGGFKVRGCEREEFGKVRRESEMVLPKGTRAYYFYK